MDTRSIRVLWVARYDYRPDWRLREHDHDYYQMLYIVDGKGKLLIDQREYDCLKDMLFFIKPKMRHALSASSTSTLKTLDIKFVINDLRLNDMVQNITDVLCVNGHEIRTLLERIRDDGIKCRPYYKDLGCMYLMQILFMLLRYQEENIDNIGNTKITNAVLEDADAFNDEIAAFIRQHYHEDLTLKDIARAMGYNPSYICQHFKKLFNSTPMHYLYKCRIQKAKELMIYSDYSLKQIAAMVGFKTIHHFTRMFHEQEGMAPAQWQKEEKEGIWKDVYLSENFQNHDITEKI